MVSAILVITAAPNGCCLVSVDAAATRVPVDRSGKVTTTMVAPRSNAMPSQRPVMSPGLDHDQQEHY